MRRIILGLSILTLPCLANAENTPDPISAEVVSAVDAMPMPGLRARLRAGARRNVETPSTARRPARRRSLDGQQALAQAR